jgi:hypothetical protein
MELAASLQAAAEKQAEAQLRREQMMRPASNSLAFTCLASPLVRTPIRKRKLTKFFSTFSQSNRKMFMCYFEKKMVQYIFMIFNSSVIDPEDCLNPT